MTVLLILFFLFSGQLTHPFLYLTEDFVKEYKSAPKGEAPLFDRSVEKCFEMADRAIESGTEVPFPKDATGEGTSALYDFHKRAFYACGTAWQLTGEKKYAEWLRTVLLNYAEIYPGLGWHPASHNSGEPGRLFYQSLDDAEWALAAAIGYDCIFDEISQSERKAIERNLFIPCARFLMEGTPENPKNEWVFNRMHNHGAWHNIAAGFIGLVTGQKEFVEKSLLGTDLSGEHGGLLQQIDELYSPDGYYYEGAYYEGYALIPALMYAQCLDRVWPELDIFHRNGSVLLKSASAMFGLSLYGGFFKMNDSGRGSFSGWDCITAVNLIYGKDTTQRWLLDIAGRQEEVLLCEAGYKVAKDIAAGHQKEFRAGSVCLRDGKDGTSGAVMVLRDDDDVVTLKACGQGGYHGHFDRLTLGWYAGGEEVLTDYGFARFPGLSLKHNGRYTPMNRSYAMTTVAHNTLVVDGRNQFGGITPDAIPYSPRVLDFDGDGYDGIQYAGAVDSTACEEVRMERWIALVKIPGTESKVVTDILIVTGDSVHTYDLPFHHEGQMMRLSAPYRYQNEFKTLGSDFGYQHLMVEAESEAPDGCVSYTWLHNGKLRSITTATDASTELYLLRCGANDPDFILDRHPVFMVRKRGERQVFASCMETCGEYDLSSERLDYEGNLCTGITISETNGGCEVKYTLAGGRELFFLVGRGRLEVK